MIRLHTLLQEISLETTAPYATQFVWTPGEAGYDSEAQAADIRIHFEMSPLRSAEGEEFAFAYAMPSHTSSGYTVTHAKSVAHGQLSYLRILRTALEALLDFLAQHAPQAVDVTGFDTAAHKDLQKTRLYRRLAEANRARFQQLGYDILWRGGRLWIVQTGTARHTRLQQQ